MEVHRRAANAAWADPTHPSSEGRRAATWLDAARSTVSGLTGFPHVRFLTSRDHALRVAARGQRTIASATHRRAVLEWCDQVLPVDADGQADWSGADGCTLLLQAANEETGVIDSPRTHPRSILDASQTLGRAPLPSDADVVVAHARAWGSPADVSLVLSRRALDTAEAVSVPAAIVAVDALATAMQSLQARAEAEAVAMQALEDRILTALPDVQFHGERRVGHVRSLSVLHLDAETLMRALDAEGFVVGSGSACVQDGTPSHVLAAMGRITHGNLRLALPVDCDLSVLDDFADALIRCTERLRHEAGVAGL